MAECLYKKRNTEKCSCIHSECERYGICCECIRFHMEKKQVPACIFKMKENND